MDLSTQLHLLAGLGAAALGVAVLAREPGRLRNRLFALLCGSLVVWNLGMTALAAGIAPRLPWRVILLLGGCAAAPLSIHFAVIVADLAGRGRRVLLAVAYAAGFGLWLSAWRSPDSDRQWSLAALVVLGALMLTALAILARHVLVLPSGRERRTMGLVLAAGVLAVGGGLSDFIPRDLVAFPKLGPPFVLLLLLIVSAVVVRHRFLDVDVYLARAVALVAAATGVALLFLAVTKMFGAGFVPLLVTSLVVLAVAGPLGRLLLSRTGDLLRGSTPLVAALLETSRGLPLAHEADEVWEAVHRGRRALPRGVHLTVHLRDELGGPFRVAYPSETDTVEVAANGAVPRLLERDGLPITRRMLHIESREEHAGRRALAREGLRQMAELDLRMIVPLVGEDRLLGWVGVGGGDSEVYLRQEVAAALHAVGHQAVASLDRVRALERARRREALAVVGEMAAGLAHEVRNPVAAIRGAAQAITPASTPGQAREMLEVIEEETARLGRVVGEFLDYARPASPRREAVDLAETAERVARDAGLAGFGLHVTVDAAHDAPPAAGDPDQLRRAFENLARNAAEAQGPGGRLQVRIAREGDRVAVRFEDDGPGISEDEIARLFQPFHSTRPGGTGLGLALVHRIVEAHGGEIRVEGRAGRGAAFTLALPVWRDGVRDRMAT